MLRLIFPVLLAVVTLAIAVLRIGDRYLEEWVVVFLRYHRYPSVSLWRPVAVATEARASADVQRQPFVDEEE